MEEKKEEKSFAEDALKKLSVEINRAMIDELMDVVSAILEGKKISPNNVLPIITQTMTLAANLQISGPSKKDLVLYVIKKYVADSWEDHDAQDEILMVIDTVAPAAIDLLISASKSKFAFKIKKKFCCC